MAGAQGGDVSGTTRIDVTMGEAIPVASASFDAGYLTEQKRSMPDTTMADLVQGFCSYGRSVGNRG